ncbi:hypothetical protein H1C71_039873, partial [Ictidomys tridecemlineatus]
MVQEGHPGAGAHREQLVLPHQRSPLGPSGQTCAGTCGGAQAPSLEGSSSWTSRCCREEAEETRCRGTALPPAQLHGWRAGPFPHVAHSILPATRPCGHFRCPHVTDEESRFREALVEGHGWSTAELGFEPGTQRQVCEHRQ